MKYIVIGFVLAVVHYSAGNVIPNKLGQCSREGTFCQSCRSVSTCVATDYGMMAQATFTCAGGQTCLNGKCVSKNPLCDGTVDIPFQCHVPGVFPDPFDCQSYHYCVVVGQNETNLLLEDFEHKCQDDESGQKWAYDARTNFCSEPLPADGVCRKWPVPLCFQQGQTTYLEENESIYFICENLRGLYYPQLYACPHGSKYNPYYRKCGVEDITTPSPPVTTTAGSTITSPTSNTPYTSTTSSPYTTTMRTSTTTSSTMRTTTMPSTTVDYTTGWDYTVIYSSKS